VDLNNLDIDPKNFDMKVIEFAYLLL